MPVKALRNFLRLESAGGILLIVGAVLAMVLSNSPLREAYDALLNLRLAVTVGDIALDKPLLLWINDGLMAIFFFLIGLEIKREVLEGQLSSRDQIALPAISAVGGFVVPVLIYAWFNNGNIQAMNGWAIPAATDIAFALGILSLLGNRVPLSLKIFLTSVAIFDDVAAIVVIALFYSEDLSLLALILAGIGTISLLIMNRLKVARITAYALVGIAIWVFVLKSGVHATLAGIIVALSIPLKNTKDNTSPLRQLEHSLHPWVAYMILPLFAFANAGVSLTGIGDGVLFGSVSLGIAAGLFIGKQAGVFLSVWLAIKLKLARMPSNGTWGALYGVSLLTGIGFTMSLFIGTLAFEHGGFDYSASTRVGVLIGSTLSAIAGYLVLRFSLPQSQTTTNRNPLSATFRGEQI